MNIKRILCPVDFSDFNKPANEYASMLAKSTGARITYLYAYLPDVMYGEPALFDTKTEEKQILKDVEDNFSPTCEGVKASYVVEFGTPADCIVDYANKNQIDLIVLGTHGRTGLRRVLMGSVAEAIVRRAGCPVLALKADSKILQTSK